MQGDHRDFYTPNLMVCMRARSWIQINVKNRITIRQSARTMIDGKQSHMIRFIFLGRIITLKVTMKLGVKKSDIECKDFKKVTNGPTTLNLPVKTRSYSRLVTNHTHRVPNWKVVEDNSP